MTTRSRDHRISTPFGTIAAREFPGEGDPFVFLHGFPDDSAIYDRLIPELGNRHVVTFDFAGYGKSERTDGAGLEEGQRVRETAAVVDHLGLDRVVIVGHDAGGPVAVEYSLAYPEKVSRLALLNCYFGDSPTLRFPEMIRLLGDPNLVPLADALIHDGEKRKWLLEHTASQFGYEPTDEIRQVAIIPQYFGSTEQPNALQAIRAWTGRLFKDVALQNEAIASGSLSKLSVPVDIVFGANDPYLNSGVAEHLAGLFPNSRRESIEARHWVQWDDPKSVADALMRER